jgi:hypothetical protein
MMANLKTICAFLRIGTMLLVTFDKDGKFAVLVDLLQEVQEKLCGGSLFAGALAVPRAENAQRQSAADYIVESLKAACDCDDCEC